MLWFDDLGLVFPSTEKKVEVRQFYIERLDYYTDQQFDFIDSNLWAKSETIEKYFYLKC